jgi:amino acid permease
MLDAVIVASALFLVLFAYITSFDNSGSQLSQGYIGGNDAINLNDYVPIFIAVFILSMIVVWHLSHPLHATLAIRGIG